MDFIERLFGTAPDGGNGLFELSFFLMAVGLAVMFLVRGLKKRGTAPMRRRT